MHMTHISAYICISMHILGLLCTYIAFFSFASLCKFLAYMVLLISCIFVHIFICIKWPGIFTLMHIQFFFSIFTLIMPSKAWKANQFNKYSNCRWRSTRVLLQISSFASCTSWICLIILSPLRIWCYCLALQCCTTVV